jgi:hypothetical protein
MKAKASNARPTGVGVYRGIDVDVTVTLDDGREVKGEVTLVLAAHGRPRYVSWGSPGHWVSDDLLAEIGVACADDETYTEFERALTLLESVTSDCAGPVPA